MVSLINKLFCLIRLMTRTVYFQLCISSVNYGPKIFHSRNLSLKI